jgi:RimJ/RimL family protein N-acetyltransferase
MVLSGDLSQTLITSTRLTLRAFTAADAAESAAEANARIAKFMLWNPPATETELKDISLRHISEMKAGKGLHLVIRLTSTNEFIGAQGHGYGQEAVAAVIKWASEKFHPSGFLWPVVDENAPSRRLAEALRGEIIGTRPRQKAGDKERKLLLYRIPASR